MKYGMHGCGPRDPHPDRSKAGRGYTLLPPPDAAMRGEVLPPISWWRRNLFGLAASAAFFVTAALLGAVVLGGDSSVIAIPTATVAEETTPAPTAPVVPMSVTTDAPAVMAAKGCPPFSKEEMATYSLVFRGITLTPVVWCPYNRGLSHILEQNAKVEGLPQSFHFEPRGFSVSGTECVAELRRSNFFSHLTAMCTALWQMQRGDTPEYDPNAGATMWPIVRILTDVARIVPQVLSMVKNIAPLETVRVASNSKK